MCVLYVICLGCKKKKGSIYNSKRLTGRLSLGGHTYGSMYTWTHENLTEQAQVVAKDWQIGDDSGLITFHFFPANIIATVNDSAMAFSHLDLDSSEGKIVYEVV